ncbi:PrpF domain-containing protein [Spirosoma sp. SC4-14]|uniref:PrpF domain-containing protein n=1 Tax=Spirosoma sp. SC4-14 TaxID=3128900 RepID=UPI0030CB9157
MQNWMACQVHEATGISGAISTATTCLLAGSVAEGIAIVPQTTEMGYPVEHPTGEFTVQLEQCLQNGILHIGKSVLIRTARLLSRGAGTDHVVS